jgi:hypothetical protein
MKMIQKTRPVVSVVHHVIIKEDNILRRQEAFLCSGGLAPARRVRQITVEQSTIETKKSIGCFIGNNFTIMSTGGGS